MLPQTEHIILTTVVPHEQWRTGAAEVRAASRDRLRERAAERGLALVGEPLEDLQTTTFAERVRLTLTADAVPLTPHTPLTPATQDAGTAGRVEITPSEEVP